MIRMRAPRPFFEQYTRKNLYRADAEGNLMRVVDQKTGETTPEVDGSDIADLRMGGCYEVYADDAGERHRAEADARVMPFAERGFTQKPPPPPPPSAEQSSPLVPATEEETATPEPGEAVQEPVYGDSDELPPVQQQTQQSQQRRRG